MSCLGSHHFFLLRSILPNNGKKSSDQGGQEFLLMNIQAEKDGEGKKNFYKSI